ncbi:MAG: cytochrome c oxidase subunit II [Shimia sp.]
MTSEAPISTLDMARPQTTFATAGVQAAETQILTWGLIIGASVVFAIVMGCLWVAWRRGAAPNRWWIVGGGVLFPLVVLTVFVVTSTMTLRAVAAGLPEDAITIRVTGHQFWWDVVHDPDGRALRDANEVVVPVDVPLRFELESADVIHSFWVPSVSGKMDMIPGAGNVLAMTATEIGRFRGQCAEFCGLSHPLMAFEMVVVSAADYAAYLDRLDSEARDPVTVEEQRGQSVFLNAGCIACHNVRGVADGAYLGPDLTRVGARASLGAGMWRMNLGNLAGWIADVQDMKPGANMPSYNTLSGPDLRAVSAYLLSLE